MWQAVVKALKTSMTAVTLKGLRLADLTWLTAFDILQLRHRNRLTGDEIPEAT